ncbi:MAG: 3-hydroxyacyl-CoA dehydrogenase NAD-binding domain-containing protein [Candidatus Altiarchaeota archaeon]
MGVVGTGTVGSGIAQVVLQAGFNLIWESRKKKSLEDGLKKIERNLLKSMSEKEKDKLLGNLKTSTDLKDLAEADLVVEAVVENLDIKKIIFSELDEICPPETIISSTSSSLSITEISDGLRNPERVIGLHFFNPVPIMHLAEVAPTEKTSDDVIEKTTKIAEALNKTVVPVTDSPCYVVNRILMPYLNEAVLTLEEGVAKKEDIDTAARLGLNHPIGPLALLDLIGLDVFLAIMNSLARRTKNPKFNVASLVEKMVSEGKLGRKSGQGFYKY